MRSHNDLLPLRDLEHLLAASARAREAARAAIARSRALAPAIASAQERTLQHLLASRPQSCFARIEGVVEEHRVRAVVRRDGTIVGDARLLARADLVVALGDEFADGRRARLDREDPVATSLTLVRACDQVGAVQMLFPVPESRRPDASTS